MGSLKIFLKGLLMGGADIIPGVSGGTMALITGIYERLITAIKGLSDFARPLSRGRFGESIESLKRIDFRLFIPLGIGILLAFGLGSLIIPYLLENYTAYIYAFFFGLILASVRLVHRRITDSNGTDWITGIIGFLAAFLLVGMTAVQLAPSHWYIFLCGFIAITAMLLPGISGSFILLMLGQYRFMLEALRNVRMGYLVSFVLGALLSLAISSRILAFLLKRHHTKTMCFLVGLMIGALRLPFEKVVFSGIEWTVLQVFLAGVFLVAGIAIVLIVGRYEN